jgi:hypothetical protein
MPPRFTRWFQKCRQPLLNGDRPSTSSPDLRRNNP